MAVPTQKSEHLSEFDVIAEYLCWRVCDGFRRSQDCETFCVPMLKELLSGHVPQEKKSSKLEILLSLVTVCYQGLEAEAHKEERQELLESMSILLQFISGKTGIEEINGSGIMECIAQQLILVYVETGNSEEAVNLLNTEKSKDSSHLLSYLENAVSTGRVINTPTHLQFDSFLADLASYVDRILNHVGKPLLSLFVDKLTKRSEPLVCKEGDIIMLFREMIVERGQTQLRRSIRSRIMSTSSATRTTEPRQIERESGDATASNSEQESRELFDNSPPVLLGSSLQLQSVVNATNTSPNAPTQRQEVQRTQDALRQSRELVNNVEMRQGVRSPLRQSTPRKRSLPSKDQTQGEVSSSQDLGQAVARRRRSPLILHTQNPGDSRNGVEMSEQRGSEEQPEGVDELPSSSTSGERQNLGGQNERHSSEDISIEWSSDGEDYFSVSSPTRRQRGLNTRGRQRRYWSRQEEIYLTTGVERFRVGNWSKILSEYDFGNRTAVDLKDKWRNMQRLQPQLSP